MSIDGTQIQKAGIGALLGLAALVGTVAYGRHLVLKGRERSGSDSREPSLLDRVFRGETAGFNANQVASTIHVAFLNGGWLGTDWLGVEEDLLRETVRSVPTKADWKRVEEAYFKQHNRPLMAELVAQTSSNPRIYTEIIALINSKP